MDEKRTLLKEVAYQELKALLLDGTFPPGTFLSERRLAERLGMSKTPIKVALERLETQGFIATSPQQGIVVRELSLREISEHYDIRIALETFVVGAIAGKLLPEAAASLRANLDQQQACIDAGDIQGHVEADADFHMLLAFAHDNREIIRVMQHQRERIFRVAIQISRQNPARMEASLGEHRRVFEAIVAGDGQLAASWMEEHLAVGRGYLNLS